MYRYCIEKLKDWALRKDRGVMVLRGARQVGKTTLVRLLAEELGLTLIEVNMEESQGFTDMLERREQAKDLLEIILLEQGVDKPPEEVLFFFDEAQAMPGLYAYLRYFKEKAPEYRVVAAGSLFEFEIMRESSPQGPTGRVEYAYLEPMSFEEFLRAKNAVAYKKLLSLSLKEPVPESLHNIFTELFKQYLVSGGMPAVVKAMCEDAGLLRYDEIKSDIVTGYIDDLPKYSVLSGKKYDSELLKILYEAVMAHPANSMKYTELAPGYRAEVIRKHLSILEDARMIRRSFHTSANKMPLSANENKKDYKLYALDIGLCYSYMGLPITEIYTVKDINDLSRGVLAEQYVAQILAALPPYHKLKKLNHWESQKKSAVSEVDFVASFGGNVVPIECKPGKSSKMKSLRVMLGAKQYEFALRVYAGNIEEETIEVTLSSGKNRQTRLLSCPHYLLERFASQTANRSTVIS